MNFSIVFAVVLKDDTDEKHAHPIYTCIVTSECILDVGPLYAFWCFSFERYNGILEKMKKSWHTPEVQLLQKFSNLQTMAAVVLPENIPKELVQCFQQIKRIQNSTP